MDRYALAIALTLLALPVYAAEDHLSPEDSLIGGTEYLSAYDEQIRNTLKDAYVPKVIVRMVGLPSFSADYVIGLGSKAVAGRRPPYEVFTPTPSTQMWTYQNIGMLKSGQMRVLG